MINVFNARDYSSMRFQSTWSVIGLPQWLPRRQRKGKYVQLLHANATFANQKQEISTAPMNDPYHNLEGAFRKLDLQSHSCTFWLTALI